MSDEAALEVAKRAHKAARYVASEADFEAKMAPLKKALTNKVRIERLPPFDAKNRRFARPFVEGTFSVPKVPGLSSPVKTKFGWHVIYVAETLPPSTISFEEAKETLSGEVLPDERRYQAKALIDKLQKEGDVFVFEAPLKSGGTEK
jgi:hypothetical protein